MCTQIITTLSKLSYFQTLIITSEKTALKLFEIISQPSGIRIMTGNLEDAYNEERYKRNDKTPKKKQRKPNLLEALLHKTL